MKITRATVAERQIGGGAREFTAEVTMLSDGVLYLAKATDNNPHTALKDAAKAAGDWFTYQASRDLTINLSVSF
jgi:hypothetical protein